MTKTFIVTGGTGFIGSALVRRLVREGHTVRVIDNDLRGSRRRLADIEGHFELAACDVRDADAVSSAARGADSILHLAALNGTENFYKRPELVLDVGVRGMYAVLEASRRNGIEELILASSSEAYQTPPVVPTPEDVPLTIPNPWEARYSYGGSKLISEIMLANYNRDVLKRAIIFRPHNVYGPDMGWEHVLPQFITRAREQTARHPEGAVPFPIQGDGRQTRSFIYIDDFIDALMIILSRGEHRNVYHIGTEEEHTIADVVGILFRHLGREVDIQPGPAPSGGTLRRCPATGKIRALGFAPKYTLADGIRPTAEWYLSQEPSGGTQH